MGPLHCHPLDKARDSTSNSISCALLSQLLIWSDRLQAPSLTMVRRLECGMALFLCFGFWTFNLIFFKTMCEASITRLLPD